MIRTVARWIAATVLTTKTALLKRQGQVQPTPPPEGGNQENLTTGNEWNWPKTLTIVSVLTNVGLFILGGVGSCFIYRQLVAMESSNEETRRANKNNLDVARQTLEESRRSLEISQRARVGVETIEDFKIAAGESKTSVRLKNTGSTPASNLRAVIGWGVRETPLPENFTIEAEGKTEPAVVLLPAGHGVSNLGTGPNLTEQGVAKVRDGRLRLYLWGRVTYDDAFGKRRETRFCAVHERNTDLWNFCPHSNWAN